MLISRLLRRAAPPEEQTPPQSAPVAALARHVVCVCEEPSAVGRVLPYLQDLPPSSTREDLSVLEAIERLDALGQAKVDLLLFAPRETSETFRTAAQALLDKATHAAGEVKVLLAPEQAFELRVAPSVQVIRADAAARGPAPKAARWQMWRGKADEPAPEAAAAPDTPVRMISFQPLGGGVGCTTLASGFASAIAQASPKLSVLLVDLDLQFGRAGLYLNCKDNPRIDDLYGMFNKLDLEALRACIEPVSGNLGLLAAPSEVLPLDALDSRRMPKFLTLLRGLADLVVLDLPAIAVEWMEPIWRESDLLIGVANCDLRASHQLRKLQALSAGSALTQDRSEIWLNRLPPKPSVEMQKAIEALAEGVAPRPMRRLPEGGVEISFAQMQGQPLHEAAPRSALIKALDAEAKRLMPRVIPSPSAAAKPLG